MFNVPLRGSELTIEPTQGKHGPIQDRLVLERAMLLTLAFIQARVTGSSALCRAEKLMLIV